MVERFHLTRHFSVWNGILLLCHHKDMNTIDFHTQSKRLIRRRTLLQPCCQTIYCNNGRCKCCYECIVCEYCVAHSKSASNCLACHFFVALFFSFGARHTERSWTCTSTLCDLKMGCLNTLLVSILLLTLFILSRDRLKLYARYVVKNWIYRIGSSFHVNVAIKCACGAGIAFESRNRDCVQHVVLRMVMIHTSSVQSMLQKC